MSVLLTFLVVFSGCAAQNTHPTANLSGAESASASTAAAGQTAPEQLEDLRLVIPPPPYFYVPPRGLGAQRVNLKSAAEILSQRSTKPGPARLVEGYRVQVFSGRESEPARAVESRISAVYPHAVYLVFEAPLYKLRVGNFISRDEAVAACDSLRAGGYRDAWVVKTHVESAR